MAGRIFAVARCESVPEADGAVVRYFLDGPDGSAQLDVRANADGVDDAALSYENQTVVVQNSDVTILPGGDPDESNSRT